MSAELRGAGGPELISLKAPLLTPTQPASQVRAQCHLSSSDSKSHEVSAA